MLFSAVRSLAQNRDTRWMLRQLLRSPHRFSKLRNIARVQWAKLRKDPTAGRENVERMIRVFTAGWTRTEWEIRTLLAEGAVVVAERVDRTWRPRLHLRHVVVADRVLPGAQQ